MSKKLRAFTLILAIILSIGNIGGVHGTSGGGHDNASLPTEHKTNFAEDRVLVKLADNQDIRAMSPDFGIGFSEMRLLNPSKETDAVAFSSTTDTVNTQNNVFLLTLEDTGADAVERALKILNANPAVEIAEPDYLYEVCAIPNDPLYDVQYALQKMNLPQAWDITTGSKSVVVGIIDTGIEGTHPDLIDNLWVNPNPNQNGYINDIHGYNFTYGVGGIPTDKSGHGTHVAGITGAKGNNEEGIAGINWDVSLAWLGISAGGNYISISAAIEALNYANSHGIMITNNSYGGRGYSELFKQAIANYRGLFVAAAGNSGLDSEWSPVYPANYDLPNIISVASTTASDTLCVTSNYGKNSVHVAAPGLDIISTYLIDSYRNEHGTSMAAPQVAGIAALIQANNPTWSALQVKAAICGTTRQVPQLSSRVMYGGIVDAHAALQVRTFYSVTYDFNDGASEPFKEYTVAGIKLEPKMLQEREGYVFAGWHTSADESSLFDFNTEINRDITLYAQWVRPEPGMYWTEFPDAIFRREILKQVNAVTGGGRTNISIIDDSDLNAFATIKSLTINNYNDITTEPAGIRDMTGIGYLSELQYLNCNYNLLTELDLSCNAKLMRLDCKNNQLTKLDITNNTALEIINCSNNQLTVLDVSRNTALEDLNCINNQLTTLDVSSNTVLKWLYCADNQLTTLDVSGNPEIGALYCVNNQLSTLDVSNNYALVVFHCSGNQLIELDVSKNYALQTLGCSDNQLIELDVSNNYAIVRLDCSDNQLLELDVSNNAALQFLWCSSNQLTALDVSGNTTLRWLHCNNNQLTMLDVSKNTALEWFHCNNNQLTMLDVSKDIRLRELLCHNNYMSSPDSVIGWQNHFNNAGSSSSDPFWFNPQKAIPTPPVTPTPSPKGDVNDDGVINAADVTMLRYYISASDKAEFVNDNPTFSLASADVNDDGIINEEDVALLRRYLAATNPSTVPLGK